MEDRKIVREIQCLVKEKKKGRMSITADLESRARNCLDFYDLSSWNISNVFSVREKYLYFPETRYNMGKLILAQHTHLMMSWNWR